MAKEVKVLSAPLSAGSWSSFEQLLARHVNEGWVVVGFSAARDVAHGDTAYVILQRDLPVLIQPPKPTASHERPGS